MRESATDLQRAIRYVCAHADDYRIKPKNIALVGSLPEVPQRRGAAQLARPDNGTALDSSYPSRCAR